MKRILLGSDEIAPDDPIMIEPCFTGPLFVLLSPNGGRIEGLAATPDGEPMANAAVTLLPLDMPETAAGDTPSALQRLGPTDRNRNYTLSGIAPGEYRLFAWEANQSVPFLDPEFMRRFTARGERVSIQEGDGLSLNLEVIPESDIR